MFTTFIVMFPVALAQQVPDAHAIDVVPSGGDIGDFITTWQPDRHTVNESTISGLFEYAEWSTLRWLDAKSEGNEFADALEPNVDYLAAINVGGMYAVHKRAALSVMLPVWVVPVFPSGTGEVAVGDARISIPVGLILPTTEREGFGVSTIPHFDVPSGDTTVHLGENRARVGGTLAFGYGSGPFGLALNLGANAGVGQTNATNDGPRGFAALGVSSTLADAVSFGMELTSTPALSDASDESSIPLEGLVSARGKLFRGLTWSTGYAHTLTKDNSLPLYRVFTGIGVVPHTAKAAPAPGATPTGLVQVMTQTTTGQPVDAQVRFIGNEVLPPYALGADGQGEYPLSTGQWRVLITAQNFSSIMQNIEITANGTNTINVILQPGMVSVSDNEIIIKEKILFAFDKADIEQESMSLLREVAATLMAHDWIGQVEVQGHTDSTGNADYNLDLSQRRVESVRNVLIDFGTEPKRLVAIGYGESQPLVSNDTDANRARNRRVQFIIVTTTE